MGTLSKAFPSNLSLAERRKLKQSGAIPALLLDVSGSMVLEIEDGSRRIDALRSIVKNLDAVGQVFAFSHRTEEITKDSIPEPAGGTYLGAALKHLKDKGITNAVVITDGEASDTDFAREQAVGMNLKIMFVGTGKRPSLLDEIGSETSTEDLKQIKELTGKVQLLLTDGTGQHGKKDIQL